MVEHFTVAFYYQKLDFATSIALKTLGLDPENPDTPRMSRCVTQFSHELVAGDIYRIETVQLGHNRLGHRLYNAATNTICTHFDQFFTKHLGDASIEHDSDWDGPDLKDEPKSTNTDNWLLSGRDLALEKDLDRAGNFTGHACILRFSAAGEHLRNHIGMTPAYMRENRIGFSTFSFDFKRYDRVKSGVPLTTESTITRIGRTSMQILHRLTTTDGYPIAELQQTGVHLDKDRRRPSPFPDVVRDLARCMI